MLFINNQEDLNKACKSMAYSQILSVDTEFLRRDTYFPILSIIQIKMKDHNIVIDVLSNINLLPFKDLLLNNKILKIFHAPREDFFIFYYLFKILPQNIFDTQLAADVCNIGNSLSYSDLCYKICGVTIDKKYQKANWLERPINIDMLNYAIKDVEYLENIYEVLMKIIREKNLYDNYQNKINSLLDHQNYIANSKKIVKKIHFQDHSEDFMSRMEIFVSYREELAIQLNLPRQHFINDKDLVKICQRLPISEKDLSKLDITSKYLNQSKYKNQLFDLILGFSELN